MILLLVASVYSFSAAVSGVIHSPTILLFGLLFLNYWGEIHAFNVFFEHFRIKGFTVLDAMRELIC